MARSIRRVLILGAALALLLSTVSAASAGGRKVSISTMTGLPVGNMELNGLSGGGVPWSIDEGHVQLFADGRLHVDVEGLVVDLVGHQPGPDRGPRGGHLQQRAGGDDRRVPLLVARRRLHHRHGRQPARPVPRPGRCSSRTQRAAGSPSPASDAN